MDFEEKLRLQKEQRAKQDADAKAKRVENAAKRNAVALEKAAQIALEKHQQILRERELEAQKHAEIRKDINKDALVKRELALFTYLEKKRAEEAKKREGLKQLGKSDSQRRIALVSQPSAQSSPSPPKPKEVSPVPTPESEPEPEPSTTPVIQEPTPVKESPSAPEPTPAPPAVADAPAAAEPPTTTPPKAFVAKRPAPPASSPFTRGGGAGPAVTQMDRSSKGLTEFDPEVLAAVGLKKLGLARNKINAVPGHLSSTLSSLESLDLSYNGFQGDVFGDSQSDSSKGLFGFSGLKELLLSGNRISSLPSFASFSGLVQTLTVLDLSNNRLKSLPEPVYDLVNLEKLQLNHNLLTEVSSRIGGLVNLKNLHLSENQLAELPSEGLSSLGKLTTLLFADNKLKSLPDDIGSLVSLTELDLARNELSVLPEAMGSLSLLQKLNLARNNLEALPESMFGETSGLFELNTLILRGNRLTLLTPGFYRLSGLKKLDLTSNKLTSLSSEIGNFYQLRELLIADNLLEAIPDEYGYIECLETINIAHNRITGALPPSNYFVVNFYFGYNDLDALPDMTGMEYIQELYISGNKKLGGLPSYVYTLTSLVKLYANNIGMTELSSEIKALTNLEVLDIANNELASLPDELAEVSQLRSLDISNNKLTSVPDALGNLWELQILDASHNSISALPQCFASLAERGAELVYHTNSCATERVGARDQLSFDKISRSIGSSDKIGRRPTMEDAFLVEPNFHGIAKADLVGVFDGHAGRAAAEFAADNFAEVLRTKLTSQQVVSGQDGEIASALTAALQTVNQLFREHLKTGPASIKYTGTTGLVALLTPENRLHIANVGDTRAVLARKGSAEALRLSRDHKPCDFDEEDRISSLGGFVVISNSGGPARVNGSLAVSRGIGDFHMTPFVSDEPCLWQGSLEGDDTHLILGCDGVWDEVSDEESVRLLNEVGVNGDPLVASVRLRDLAYLRGSDDNISVIVLKLN